MKFRLLGTLEVLDAQVWPTGLVHLVLHPSGPPVTGDMTAGDAEALWSDSTG